MMVLTGGRRVRLRGSDSDSDDSGDDTETEGGGESSGNADITAYCDKVQEVVDNELLDDPTNAKLQTEVTDSRTS
jgi:hypothetical protein